MSRVTGLIVIASEFLCIIGLLGVLKQCSKSIQPLCIPRMQANVYNAAISCFFAPLSLSGILENEVLANEGHRLTSVVSGKALHVSMAIQPRVLLTLLSTPLFTKRVLSIADDICRTSAISSRHPPTMSHPQMHRRSVFLVLRLLIYNVDDDLNDHWNPGQRIFGILVMRKPIRTVFSKPLGEQGRMNHSAFIPAVIIPVNQGGGASNLLNYAK